jgi:YHS domain-containing protein
MRSRKIITLVAAVAISLAAAAYRFGDSAHSIGLVSLKGGKVRHPFVLEGGQNRYSLIGTATVLPPFRGDVLISLEGLPEIDYDIFLSRPVIDLGLHKLPELRNRTLYGLRPRDRISLWVRLHPPVFDPVCRMKVEEGFLTYRFRTRQYYFCSEVCRNTFLKRPKKYTGKDGVCGKYNLVFHDTRSGAPVLNMPVRFKGKDEMDGKSRHPH